MCRRLVVFGTGTGARPAFRPGRQIPDRTVHRRASRPRYALPPGAGGKTIAQMRYILDAEHPDLVVFTGDVVTGKPAAQAWHRVLEPVAERNLPFCVVLGNHDAEQDLTRAEIGRIVTSYAGTLNTLGAGANWPTWCWRSPGRRNLRRCSTASIRTIIQQSRLSTATVGLLRSRWAGTAPAAPPIPRPTAGSRCRRWRFPYRPARIRRCMAEPRQYACRPCRRG